MAEALLERTERASRGPVMQQKQAAVLQDDRPRTGKPLQLRGGTKGKKNSGGKPKAQKQQSKAQRSLNNIYAYETAWANKNNPTIDDMKIFCGWYTSGIRGHASGDSSKGKQGNTNKDCQQFMIWFKNRPTG